MKRFLMGLTAVALAVGAALAQDPNATSTPPVRSVLVVTDNTPFTIKQDDVVRLLGKGIAGTKIEIKVTGPAKVIHENQISVLRKGRHLLGAAQREFEIVPTGTGKVTAAITTTPPQSGAAQSVLTYEFEVK